MGGGVSLGTFSGAALAESIKQAVLRAGYIDGEGKFQQYNEVIIDVFAGASAGSMSLAIMLRGLAHQTDEEIARAINDLKNDQSFDFNSLSAKKQRALIVAQVVKNLEADIWIDEINIDKLLGVGNTSQQANLVYEAGILRRGALEDIANKYFALDDAYASKFERKCLLADEVIFGSTLANLTSIQYNCAPKQIKDPVNFAGAADAFTSSEHKELRVFHLFFSEQNKDEIDKKPEDFPAKWVRYHTGDKQAGYFGNICDKGAWARMVATSMACGAFPFAFEPVVLERFKFEYGSDWPEELNDNVCKLATGYTGNGEGYTPSYPFTYMDGGTFNNEPVREAFRMAAYLDAGDASDFDRVVVFVDPSVDSSGVDYRLPVHQTYGINKPRAFLGALDGYDLVHRSTLDRLLAHLGTLVSMIVDEGRVNENDKIAYVYDLFENKINYYNLISNLIVGANVNASDIDGLRDQLDDILSKQKLNDIVPVGSLTVRNELIRVAKENPAKYGSLKDSIDIFINGQAGAVDPSLYKLLLEALYTIFIDLLMGLSGKSKADKIIAIAPIKDNDGEAEIVTLPGDYLEAFSGFTSKYPNIYAAEVATYSAQWLMNKLGLFDKNFKLPPFKAWDKQAEYEKDFRQKLLDIDERIDSLFKNSSVIDLFPGADQIILSGISSMVKKSLSRMELKADPYYTFVFTIEVNDKKFEIDGSGNFEDIAPVKAGSKLLLITELKYYYTRVNLAERWDGHHAQNSNIVINKDGFLVLPDRKFCRIDLPGHEAVTLANMMPNPKFTYRLLKDADAGKTLPAADWVIDPGVNIVERTLL